MEYREIGRTGKKAGVIGLGCEHLDGKPYAQVAETVHAALDGGVNVLDVFMPGRAVREHIARALGDRRKDVYIQGHICSTDIKEQYDISRDMPTVRRYFEDLLRIFGGYIDFGMLFFLDTEDGFRKVFDGGIADYAQRLKRDGHIGHIGFSSHNPVIAAKVVETGLVETMLFSINAAFDLCSAETYTLDALDKGWNSAAFRGLEPGRAALYARCEQRGVGISVMKTLGAGKLISAAHTPFSRPMTVAQCVRFALDRPAVFSALIGCKTADEMRVALAAADADERESDYTAFLGEMPNDFAGRCVYCGHCQPCPVGIDIATVHKYLDIALLDAAHIPPSIRTHYAAQGARGGDCVACGHCVERCPFGVPIIENMTRAEQLLGG